jgi:hypothetical protein
MKCYYRIAMSGTPAHYNIMDWVNQSKWIVPEQLSYTCAYKQNGPKAFEKVVKQFVTLARKFGDSSEVNPSIVGAT